MAKKDVGFTERLDSVMEKLTHVVIDECDPANWSGGEKDMKDLTKDERGDRFWDKKNAAATVTILVKIHSLIDLNKRTNGGKIIAAGEADEELDLAKQVRAAEKQTAEIMQRIAESKAQVKH